MSDIFDKEIAACTIAIEGIGEKDYKGTGRTPKNYLNRGALRCLNQSEKEDRCSSAIEDLSIALHLESNNTEALYYRAYAYFISKEYRSASADCNTAINAMSDKTGAETAPFHELLGNIHFAQRKYGEAEESYQKAIVGAIKETHVPILSSSLLENYRKACAKVRGN